MADAKLSALTNITAPIDAADEFYVVDDPGGTPLSRAATFADVQFFNRARYVTYAHGSVGGGSTLTINLNDGQSHSVTMTGNITLDFSNWVASDDYQEVTFHITNGATGTWTWDTAIKWAQGDGTWTATFPSAITLETTGYNCCVFWTFDGGTTIYGTVQ